MRALIALSLAVGLFASSAEASTPPPSWESLGISPADAGQASYFAIFACGIAPSAVDAMKADIERLAPGVTHAALFAQGVSTAMTAVREARQTVTPDDSELVSVQCPGVTLMMQKLAATRPR